jgi:hypothetical protein
LSEQDTSGDTEDGMGCVLRVYGDNLNVDELLACIKLQPCCVRRKGKPRYPNSKRLAESNGFHVTTSDASERDLPRQIKETTKFLNANRNDLLFIKSFAGVEEADLNFSNHSRIRGDIVGQNDSFPTELISIAAEFGLGINLATYGSDE